ncbi:DUF4172 domain-containing protein [Polaribacter undariae]|uniref:DUF4172 domain-containing protein n=1 Tax=Polaribacter sejongensis TaxID=985043 RepID=A0AAJ1VGF8_9FLAO|nr:DUF4172 domain-containing protein [Polaribacter undariae]MDN3619556.1 DUF4172 domain-containing protein [Polaribacter undariae]UWD33811.1 DUF4172 domain-containing protein [Polaribacter undariae]
MKGLSKKSHTQTTINILASEAIKTTEIEREYLSRKDVMSSVRNNLKISTSYENVKDIKAKEIGELVTMVQNTFKEMLFD